MAMSLVIRSEMCQCVPDRWAQQYRRLPSTDWKYHVTQKLADLPMNERTPEKISAIIGNDSWTSNECDECDKDCEVLVRLGEEPDYDARWCDVCFDCLSKACDMANLGLY